MAVEIRVLRSGDEAILARVADGVFDRPVDPGLTREFLADPRHHIAVAVDDGVVVGFASGVHYIHPDAAAQLWINEVSLAESHRRRGLGMAIMRALFQAGRESGCAEAWVLTYRDNGPAMALLTQGDTRETARP